ncbi:Protein Prrc2A [Manis pentadactyla]|nr:Protein Prrc2A [Manis pentadactyla]
MELAPSASTSVMPQSKPEAQSGQRLTSSVRLNVSTSVTYATMMIKINLDFKHVKLKKKPCYPNQVLYGWFSQHWVYLCHCMMIQDQSGLQLHIRGGSKLQRLPCRSDTMKLNMAIALTLQCQMRTLNV